MVLMDNVEMIGNAIIFTKSMSTLQKIHKCASVSSCTCIYYYT